MMSPAQIAALDALEDYGGRGGLNSAGALVYIGKHFRRTLRALERGGFVRYFPYGADGYGAWRITGDGRRALEAAEQEA